MERKRKSTFRTEAIMMGLILIGALCAECIPVLLGCVAVAGIVGLIGGVFR